MKRELEKSCSSANGLVLNSSDSLDSSNKSNESNKSNPYLTCCRCGKFSDDVHIRCIRDNRELSLCDKCYSKLSYEMDDFISRFKGEPHFEAAANEILAGLKEMGFDLDESNFKSTPKRFARAYQEIFEGIINTDIKIKDILSTTFPANGDDTMVVAKDIICFSMCPHHLLPVEYHVCVGYIPNKNGQVLGISKLNRLVVLLSKQPTLQESFTQQIVNCLYDIGVYGVMALVEGQHMCMRMRGAKAQNATITTTAVSGIFADDRSTKEEFLKLITDRIKFR